jgi:hypothetical protein
VGKQGVVIKIDNLNESKVLFIMPVTKYTDELADAICLEIACGDGVNVACEKHKIEPRTFFRWLLDNNDLRQKYMRARDNRADAHFEGSKELMDDLRTGRITSDQARIMLDEIKWKCAKQAPKKYSDKYTVAGDPESPLISLTAIVNQIEGTTVGLPQITAQ